MDSDIKSIIKEVADDLSKNGYDPIKQITGYLVTNDLGFIPKFNNNRNKIATLDKDLILESMLKDYIK